VGDHDSDDATHQQRKEETAMELQGRTMPYSVEAEQSVLGSILIDKDCISTVTEMIVGEDFYFDHNRTIFEAMQELFNTNQPIDVVTVSDALGRMGQLDAIGGLSYLAAIATNVPTTANVRYYARIIADKSRLRQLIKVGSSIAEMGYEAGENSEFVMEHAEKLIYDLSQGKESRGVVHINDLLGDSFALMQKMAENKGKLTGVPTGFGYLDSITGGLQRSDLILIAARPAMGKTSFAMNIAQNAAIRSGVPTAIFNLEMSREQLTNRIICAESMVGGNKLKDGTLDVNDWVKIGESLAHLASAPIYIDDSSMITVSDIRAKCRRLKQQHGLGLIVIDYLQLMQGKGRNENRQQEVSEISRSLKIMAKELNVPIITLSQLSRSPESRSDKRPMLSDLRESGAIEQDADIVMFLYRDDYYNNDSPDRNIAECIIAKHRNGETGTVKLWWDGAHTKFMHLDKEHMEG